MSQGSEAQLIREFREALARDDLAEDVTVVYGVSGGIPGQRPGNRDALGGEVSDRMVPQGGARFLPDSVVGFVAIGVRGNETTLYFLADEAQRFGQSERIARSATEGTRPLREMLQRPRHSSRPGPTSGPDQAAPRCRHLQRAVEGPAVHLGQRDRDDLERPAGMRPAGEIACPLTFDVAWVTSGAHHEVVVHPGGGRGNMNNWYTNFDGSTVAHEFGHMIGHPDEYPDEHCPHRHPVNTGTIMAELGGRSPTGC